MTISKSQWRFCEDASEYEMRSARNHRPLLFPEIEFHSSPLFCRPDNIERRGGIMPPVLIFTNFSAFRLADAPAFSADSPFRPLPSYAAAASRACALAWPRGALWFLPRRVANLPFCSLRCRPMKRPKGKAIPANRTRDIKQDFSIEQRAAVGAVTLSFNELQYDFEAMLHTAMGVPEWLFLGISSRISSLDLKTEIINLVLERAISNAHERDEIKRIIGEVKTFAGFRNAITHARMLNADLGIGLNLENRAKEWEVLMQAPALDIFYDHIIALQNELSSARNLLASVLALKALALDDQNKAPFEEAVRGHQTQFQESRNRRQSLKPMPKFPTELEFQEAVNRWRASQQAVLMGWFQPEPMPRLPPRGAWIGDTDVVQPILPQEEKKT
jgi:hypothetical protein